MSVGEIAYDFESAFAFISTLFPKTDYEPKGENEISLSQVLWYFQVYGQFFRRLQAVENELEMSINPELVKTNMILMRYTCFCAKNKSSDEK